MTTISFEHARNVGDEFLTLLSQLGINPPVGAAFDDELLSLTELFEVWKNPSLVSPERCTDLLRMAGGLLDFAAKVLAVKDKELFQQFIPHLKLIASAKYPGASLLQNMPAPNDTARKMTELYFACLAAMIGGRVSLDHPERSKGDNPDVMFSLNGLFWRTQRWALAIKSVAAKNGQTIFDNIKDAAGQIDRSAAGKGMVVINARDWLNHQQFVAPTVPFETWEQAAAAMKAQLMALAESSQLDRDDSEFDSVFSGRTVVPILFMGQSLTFLPTTHSPRTPTVLKVLYAWDCGRTRDRRAMRIARQLNDRIHLAL